MFEDIQKDCCDEKEEKTCCKEEECKEEESDCCDDCCDSGCSIPFKSYVDTGEITGDILNRLLELI